MSAENARGPKIIIAGAPASGKGTQCSLIKDRYGVVHLSTGDMLREAVKNETPVGVKAKSFMDEGKLVPDDVIIDIVQNRLEEEDCQTRGWLLDGFPRTRAQADALSAAGIKADSFLLLNVPDEMLIARVVGRRLDPETGDIYHLDFNPPPPEIADSRLIQRADDTAEKAQVRLDTYHNNIAAIKECYEDIIRSLDGSVGKAEVFENITKELDSKLGQSGEVVEKETEPIEGMKPGTSGLRKKVTVWREGAYLNNFVQSVLDTFPQDELKGSTVVISGDGRFFNAEAIQTIIRMAAANGVGRVWVGKGGLMSTPAVSAVLREREGGAAYAGIVLTASHNPGGPDEDFGIKFNTASGSPANEGLTNAVYARTLELKSYRTVEGTPDVNLDVLGKTMIAGMVVEVVDPVEEYVVLLKSVFDFPRLKTLVARPDFNFVFDGMHGVAGPYATRVFVDELGAPEESLLRCVPQKDFGGSHPDPNLTYAADLVRRMGLDVNGQPLADDDQAGQEPPSLGAAADGDADRNMILGKRFFVTPSDSLAVIAANAAALPFFERAGGLAGAARSMPTSGALDRVCAAKGIPMFETPTGWKFFGNLMDAEELGHERSYAPFLCGEESFGTGSNHVREKDGIWAVLAWMSIISQRNPDKGARLVGVQDVMEEHWREYGRNFYSRYDYEGVASEGAQAMMEHLRSVPAQPGDDMGSGFMLKGIRMDDFEYTDPIDGSVSKNQGVRVMFMDGSRIVFRLSGTGSVGATVRIYMEKYEPEVSKQGLMTADVLRPLVDIGLKISRLEHFTGRASPTVVT
ncbi:unnamed protein product [Ascophyllum nodosum]